MFTIKTRPIVGPADRPITVEVGHDPIQLAIPQKKRGIYVDTDVGPAEPGTPPATIHMTLTAPSGASETKTARATPTGAMFTIRGRFLQLLEDGVYTLRIAVLGDDAGSAEPPATDMPIAGPKVFIASRAPAADSTAPPPDTPAVA